ncbi:hypothetical protein HID58_065995, partial [Brassica napus]
KSLTLSPTKEFRVSYGAEKPKQEDKEREGEVGERLRKKENVDKEAEAFIRLEHSKWMTESS